MSPLRSHVRVAGTLVPPLAGSVPTPTYTVDITGPLSVNAGQSATWTLATSGGTVTAIQWTVNGANAGAGGTTLTQTLAAGTYTINAQVTFDGSTTVTDPTPLVTVVAAAPGALTHGEQVNATNTGPLGNGVAYGDLETYNGTFNVTANNTTIEGLDIVGGGVDINGYTGTTIRDCRITMPAGSSATAATAKLIDISGGRDTVIEWCELDGNQRAGSVIGGSGGGDYFYRAYRCNIYGGLDNCKLGDETTIEECFLHDLERSGPDPHCDILQVSGGSTPRTNIRVVRNRLEAYKPSTGDPMNAVLQIGSFSVGGGVRNFLFADNYGDGGNFSVQDNMAGDRVVDNAEFRGNRWGTNTRYPEGAPPYTGTRIYSSLDDRFGDATDWASEVWAATGEPIRPDLIA